MVLGCTLAITAPVFADDQLSQIAGRIQVLNTAVSASAGMLGVSEEQLMACPPDKRGGMLMKARTAWFRDYLHGGSD